MTGTTPRGGTVQAIRVHQPGGPEALVLEDVELPPPGPGQALVRHTAIGVNLIDTYHRSALTGQYAIPRPAVLGVEAAGVVEAVGPGVGTVRPGDRVAYWMLLGAYAQARLVPAERLVRLPDGVSDEVAAAAMVKGTTAQYLLHRVHPVKAGDALLVHAAAGGVGQFLCQWASSLGATVIGTVGSPEKLAVARAAGCEHVILSRGEDRDGEDFVARVRDVTGGRGVDVVYDSVGQDTFLRSLDCLRPFGLMVNYGQASGPVPPFDIGVLAQKGSLFLAKPTLATVTRTRADIEALADGLFAALEEGRVRVAISRRAPLVEAAAVHRDLEARRTTGSIVLLP
ncbi:quinone oxidoreductase family protein [Azospirillum agricola]|uniref:quinone oxidoreductase family protein n=1 Tax=Azospirillum agricola TaxID=1720247 RepID=UPI000A0F3BF2|nr:quinone oxidoreductase [Azospirillum agricola]SMH61924.1 NADPH2:quinone reductase [Azospirillum lipoferum]